MEVTGIEEWRSRPRVENRDEGRKYVRGEVCLLRHRCLSSCWKREKTRSGEEGRSSNRRVPLSNSRTEGLVGRRADVRFGSRAVGGVFEGGGEGFVSRSADIPFELVGEVAGARAVAEAGDVQSGATARHGDELPAND